MMNPHKEQIRAEKRNSVSLCQYLTCYKLRNVHVNFHSQWVVMCLNQTKFKLVNSADGLVSKLNVFAQ